MKSSANDGLFVIEKEILEQVDLCDKKGNLLTSSVGWSRTPIFNCNLSGNTFRKKKWNYWYMISNSLLFSVTVSNLDYIGMVFAYAYDFKTGKFIERTVASPFGKGCNLSQNVQGNVHFENKDMQVSFEEIGKNTNIKVSSKDFGGSPLSANLTVLYPKAQETINVVIPWSKNIFQFTSKHNCLPVEGTVNLMGNNYSYNSQTDFAGLDFGRGIWPYKCMWNWSTASGIQDSHNVGLNLGGKWTDGTGMTENALLVDGIITKLSEDVDFNYNPSNLMAPWRIKTPNSARVNLIFTPIYKRYAKTDALILKSSVNQMIGTFSGTIISDLGVVINIENLMGCSEEHHARW